MIEILATVALVFSIVAIAATALLLIKREDYAKTDAEVRALRLEVTDVVDRLSTWQRRDAARIRRGGSLGATDELSGSQPVQHSLGLVQPGTKDQLRATARARGLMR